jgi:hypothetical protein
LDGSRGGALPCGVLVSHGLKTRADLVEIGVQVEACLAEQLIDLVHGHADETVPPR